MGAMNIGLVVMLWLCTALMQAAGPSDSAVFSTFQQTDPQLKQFAILQRTGVTEQLDLVIAIASPPERQLTQAVPIPWTPERKIGLFLQEKNPAGRVYLLATKSGFEDCSASVERATATDAVVSCLGEKSARYPNQKWVYDVRAKSLLKQFSYPPFAMQRIFPDAGGAVFVGTDHERLIAVAFQPGREREFRVLDTAESLKWFRRVHASESQDTPGGKPFVGIDPDAFEGVRFGPSGSFRLVSRERRGQSNLRMLQEHTGNRTRSYPLPQSTYDEFAAARPARVKDGYVRGTRIEEEIGPWKLEGDKLWFGKSFYDGEGFTGVGGFGFFDAADRKFHLLARPEMAMASVSAITLGSDAVWMGLVQAGEYGGSSKGLLRYDRQTGVSLPIRLPDIVAEFVQSGGKILAATDFGIAVVDGTHVERYFLDRTTDGRLRVAVATR